MELMSVVFAVVLGLVTISVVSNGDQYCFFRPPRGGGDVAATSRNLGGAAVFAHAALAWLSTFFVLNGVSPARLFSAFASVFSPRYAAPFRYACTASQEQYCSESDCLFHGSLQGWLA